MKERRFTEASDFLKGILEPGFDKDYFVQWQTRYATILSLIPGANQKLCVLDIGSGFGHLSILIKRIFDYEVYAIDRYSTWEERFRKAGIEFNLCELTTQSLPAGENCFDIVLFSEVIEHLFVLPHRILFDIHRVLKPHGLLILTTENLYSLLKRIRFLLGKRIIPRLSARGDEGIDPKSISDYGELHSLIQARLAKRGEFGGNNLKEYDVNELRSLLEETGFKIILERCLQEGYILRGPDGTVDLNPLHVMYRAIAKAYGSWGNQIYIVGQKG